MTQLIVTLALFAAVKHLRHLGVAGFSPAGPPFDRCDSKSAYYADLLAQNSNPSQWDAQAIIDLITVSHRNVLDNVAPGRNGDDILAALTDLWKEDITAGNVRLIYRDIPFPTGLANTQLGWEREDLWPRGRGWDLPANKEIWTDVHSKAAGDSTVLEQKKDLYFGQCGTVEDASKCISPATSETALTTEQDGKIWAPPDSFKGDVARALFYTAARYQNTLNLALTDCPPFEAREFGFLSALLQWHVQDPVSDSERARNQQSCERWQGNRNPFIDYPQLVLDVFYPQGPDQIIPNSFRYSRCAPTQAPTSSPIECSSLNAGDIAVFMFNSNDPDQVVFMSLVDIPGSIGALFVTDSPWNGFELINNEGTLRFNIPSGGIQAGEMFGFGDNSPWVERWVTVLGNNFGLQHDTGDNLFLYCLDTNTPNFVAGVSFGGDWISGGLAPEAYGTDKSALPSALVLAGSMAMEHVDNCVYSGQLQGVPRNDLARFMMDPNNFSCMNDQRIRLEASERPSASPTNRPTTSVARPSASPTVPTSAAMKPFLVSLVFAAMVAVAFVLL